MEQLVPENCPAETLLSAKVPVTGLTLVNTASNKTYCNLPWEG